MRQQNPRLWGGSTTIEKDYLKITALPQKLKEADEIYRKKIGLNK